MSQAEKRYRLLVEASPVCIHEIGLDGKILSMNPAGLSMLDLECEADIVGVPYLDAVCERHHASIATLLERALAGEASKFEFEGANGHRFTSAFVPIYADDGELVRLMGISQDVTQERELEAQLRQTQRLDSIGQLAGGIAHDFNNLLLVILGELHLADRDVQRGKSPASSLKAIRTAAERAANLTERLLALGRREPLDLVPTDINRLLAEHARIIARMLPETIAVTFTGAPALPAVNLDPAQMEEVLLNLSLNASQAMPGGGALQISTELVATVDEREPARVGVTVTDTGTG
ncbi:MAG: PAS domain-containing protein, partial [Planctomycetota bacterium]|nr:PAS domain-containing protein [Planctomycetota bacterium]